MADPQFQQAQTASVSSGSSGNALSFAAMTDAELTDYQFIVICSASSSSTGISTDLASIGWTLVHNIVVQSNNTYSGSSRVMLLEILPTATLAQRRAVIALTLTGSRVYGAARGRYSVPAGSAGRTVVIPSKAEAQTAGTAHALPPVTTTAPDSRVIGIACSDQSSGIGEQSWPSTGDYTQRVNLQGGNASERQAVTFADKLVATPTADVGGTFTSQTADEAGLFQIVLDGVGTTAPSVPDVDAGPDATVAVGAPVTRMATNTGGAVDTWAWTLRSGPGVTPGTGIGSDDELSWTAPATPGTYVLRVTGSNGAGSDFDEFTLTVVSGGGSALTTSVVEAVQALGPQRSAAPALVAAPPSGRLVLGVFSGNKNSGTITLPPGMTSRARYVNTSVSGDVATGDAVTSGEWSWTGEVGGIAALIATDISGWSFRGSTTAPSPPDDVNRTSISADLGAAPVGGTVYAAVGVDSSWGNTGAFASTPPVWTGGYEHIGVFQEAVESSGDAGGAAFALAKKDVAAGDPTACSVSWGGSDQAYLHLVQVDVTEVGGGTDPGGGSGTLVRAPRIGVDKIALRLTGGSGDVRIDFSTSADMSSPISSTAVTPGAQGDAHVPLPAELAADTVYYFRPWRGGGYIGTVRSFRTLPGQAQSQFTFGFASCRNTDEDAAVLSTLPARGVRMFLFAGDLHYRDINSSSASLYRSADDEPYTRTHLGATLTGIPNDQTWDNHDFLGDPSGGWMANKATVAQVFRERVPTPGLVESSGGIHHTYTAWGGRVRFIVLDTRYYRDQNGTDGTMLGAAQRTWLQGLLANADTPLTFIVSSVGWHSSGSDADWGFFPSERATIAGWIAAADTEVVFLCGDMHALAVARPSDGTPGGVRVWHAAALRQYNNGTKGGPYSFGPTYTEAGQYGLVTLTDTGSQISATFNGVRQGTSDWPSSDTVTVATTPPLVAPATAFDLTRWHLTLPTPDPSDGDAEQINQPQLATFANEFFYLDELSRMVGIAPVIGATTSGESGATRTELREREADYSLAKWDPLTTGRRQLTITTRVDATSITGTGARQEVIIFQIHGATGTPPIYLAAEWTSSGNPVANPRVRLFVSGTGMSNTNALVGITPSTDISIRCRVENAQLRLWIAAGPVSSLPVAPNYTYSCANFNDRADWYFKCLTYNKTPITSGATGQAEARISHLELLQPGDPDPSGPGQEPGRQLLAVA